MHSNCNRNRGHARFPGDFRSSFDAIALYFNMKDDSAVDAAISV